MAKRNIFGMQLTIFQSKFSCKVKRVHNNIFFSMLFLAMELQGWVFAGLFVYLLFVDSVAPEYTMALWCRNLTKRRIQGIASQYF
jgi:hypothetical protein